VIHTLLAAAIFTAQNPEPRKPSVTGELKIHTDFESKILGNKRRILVWLPPKYDAKRKNPYPITYFHDGQNVFDGATSFIPNQEWRADETATALIESGLIPPMILVAIDNMGVDRADEFLPTRAKMGNQEAGGKADLYADFLVKELKPFIHANYNATKDPMKTALVGSSFGGIITFHTGTTRPDDFGLLGVMSPSFWWDKQALSTKVQNWSNKPKVKIWMDTGTEEGRDMVTNAQTMRNILLEKGFKTGQDFWFVVEPGAGHNERAWAGRLDSCLITLFR
jgi:predicted alpha/beta superfamily hydrolase